MRPESPSTLLCQNSYNICIPSFKSLKNMGRANSKDNKNRYKYYFRATSEKVGGGRGDEAARRKSPQRLLKPLLNLHTKLEPLSLVQQRDMRRTISKNDTSQYPFWAVTRWKGDEMLKSKAGFKEEQAKPYLMLNQPPQK